MASIEVLNGPEVGQKTDIAVEVFFIGRDANNHLVLSDRTVSRKHAVINLLKGKYVLSDLKSLKGLLVNGVKKREAVLEHGDEIALGAVRLRFHGDGEKKDLPFPAKRKRGLRLLAGGLALVFVIALFFFILKRAGTPSNEEESKREEIRTHYELGVDLFNQAKDLSGAKREWQKAVELDPKQETDYGQKASKLLENLP